MNLEGLLITSVIAAVIVTGIFMTGMYIGYNEGYRAGQLNPEDWSDLE